MTVAVHPLHRPDAVLFDLDGTLVDTSPVWQAAYLALARDLGVDLPAGWWGEVRGRTIEGSVAVFDRARPGARGDRGEPGDPADVGRLAAELVARVEALLPSVPPRWLPGAGEFVAAVQSRGLPTALVTSTWRTLAERVLAAVGGSVSTVVGGDEVANGKPAPDIYLLAAERLGVDATRCLAVEDSPTGIAAAEAAGAHVLVVPSAAVVRPGPNRTLVGTLEGVWA